MQGNGKTNSYKTLCLYKCETKAPSLDYLLVMKNIKFGMRHNGKSKQEV